MTIKAFDETLMHELDECDKREKIMVDDYDRCPCCKRFVSADRSKLQDEATS